MRCARFAQLFSQLYVDWKIHPSHIQEIYKRSNWYGMELLSGRTDFDWELIKINKELEDFDEFACVIAIRAAKYENDVESTLAFISRNIKKLRENWHAGYILDLLTSDDKARFAEQLQVLEIELAMWLAE